jgi:secondary thiamine-phosphate synthase enzyme
MKIITETLHVKTKGQGDLVDVTPHLQECLDKSGLKQGQLTVFVVGSTAAITSFEFEPGLKKDMNRLYEKLAPAGPDYEHHGTWQDDNGSSHVRAALQGPGMTIPFTNGSLVLGTWQQVVLAEFDTRGRSREVVVQVIGE